MTVLLVLFMLFLVVQAFYSIVRVHKSRIGIVRVESWEANQPKRSTASFLLCGVQNSTDELFARHMDLIPGNKYIFDYGQVGFLGFKMEFRDIAKQIEITIENTNYEEIHFYGVSLGAKIWTEVIRRLPKEIRQKTTFYIINGALQPDDVKNPAKTLGKPLEVLSWLWPVDLLGTICMKIGHKFGAKKDMKEFCKTDEDRSYKRSIDVVANYKMTFGVFAGQVRFLNQRINTDEKIFVHRIVNLQSKYDSEIHIKSQAESARAIFDWDNFDEMVLRTSHSTLYLGLWSDVFSGEIDFELVNKLSCE